MTAVRFFDSNRWRLGVVYASGPKNVSVLALDRLRAVTLPKAEAQYFRPVEDVTPAHLARRILDRSKQLKRQRIRHAGAVAERVAAMLRRCTVHTDPPQTAGED